MPRHLIGEKYEWINEIRIVPIIFLSLTAIDRTDEKMFRHFLIFLRVRDAF